MSGATDGLSDTMRRRLEKESEANGDPSVLYPGIDDDEEMKRKVEQMPTPPPEYPQG